MIILATQTKLPMKRFILVILLALLALPIGAEAQRIDLSTSGALDPSIWRHNTDAYIIDNGWLRLNASNASGRKLISLNSTLGTQNHWQGVVQLSLLPSTRNHTYILLGCFEENKQLGEYHYLALSIGGGKRQSIALSAIRLKTQGQQPWQISKEEVLIETHQNPDALTRGGVYYSISHDQQSQALTLNLTDYLNTKIKLFAGKGRWAGRFNPNNSFGILTIYTATRHTGFKFADLSIEATLPNQDSTGAGDTDKEENSSHLPILHPLLTEIMIHPLPNSPEYIELYNPNPSPLILDDYALEFVGSRGTPKRYQLDDIEVAAKGFLVLTSSPEDLINAYPQAPQEALYKYKLPQLPNTGFRLSLLYNDKTIDEIRYDSSTLPKGMRGKRGIALERPTLDPGASWQAARGGAKTASPGQAPVQPSTDADDSQSEEQEALHIILQRAGQEPRLRLVCIATDFVGHTLLRLEGRKALETTKALTEGSTSQTMLSALRGKSGILSIYLEDSKTKRQEEQWYMKFMYR